ncbi:alpha/beta fold hydrolase [Spirosoma montaniterrae]|uniref:AB hydrolase-1 domain-containing protein n=1 Tax=Spirosoma montaniterrae TaxID=1178516 RepID=A0A1P9WUT3_9BACT|nr:alpha/beta fold hydrolase [Spirosoma montaniterrae]AQG79103.1 hypothetical protein AWR27_07075 [Spirosoma montaniterrae]
MKTTFVLVHGAFAGQYAWQLVKPLLEQAGHTVITLDLPGHGDDPTPPGSVTFAQYVDAVSQRITAEAGPVTLVGHSMAGMVISAVAEQLPDRLAKLVYLSAYLPQNGDDLQTLAGSDAESLIGPNLQFAPDYSSASLPEEVAVQVFAGDCSDEIKALVKAKARPEPLAAFQTKVELTDANFGRVPKFYIETLADQGVGNTLQRRMVAANSQVRQVYSMNCGHSAYFALPTELAAILDQLPD